MSGFENISIPWPGWKIVKELGEGGFGKVYEIERTQYGITDNDALKIIRIPKDRRQYDEVAYRLTSEDEESIRAVFSDQKDKVIHEIRAMQQLKAADNIVGIKDWSVSKLDDGYSWEIYIRMDVMTPLVQYVKKNKGLEEEEVIKLGEDICKALKQCEKENIVHRDIKPDNIMVSESGKFMLGDFGIARYLENDTTMTGIGTKPYMAPEIANYKKAGKTVDLYSLGMVLYEMLNNCRPPFINANGKYSALERENAIQRRIRGEELPEPANGSDELKKIVLKACDPEPSKRYKTAAAMLKAFEDMKIREQRETVPEQNVYRYADELDYEYERKDDVRPDEALSQEDIEKTLLGDSRTEEPAAEDPKPAAAAVAPKKKTHSNKKTGSIIIIIACIVVAVLLIGAVCAIGYMGIAKKKELVLSSLQGEWIYSYTEKYERYDDPKGESYNADAELDSYISVNEDGDVVIYVDNCTCRGKLEVSDRILITDYTIDGQSDDMDQIIDGGLSYRENSDGDIVGLSWSYWEGDRVDFHYYKKGHIKTDDENETEDNKSGNTQEIPDNFSAEDLIGQWGEPKGHGILVDLKENGELAAYVYNDNGELEHYKDGSWSIADDKEVYMNIGGEELYLVPDFSNSNYEVLKGSRTFVRTDKGDLPE